MKDRLNNALLLDLENARAEFAETVKNYDIDKFVKYEPKKKSDELDFDLVNAEYDAKKRILLLANNLLLLAQEEARKLERGNDSLDDFRTDKLLGDERQLANSSVAVEDCAVRIKKLTKVYSVTNRYVKACMENQLKSTEEDKHASTIGAELAEVAKEQESNRLSKCLMGIAGVGLVLLGVATALFGAAVMATAASPAAPISGPLGAAILGSGLWMMKVGAGIALTALAVGSVLSVVSGCMLFKNAIKPTNMKQNLEWMQYQEYNLPKTRA